ncbi:MAG: hypothetical protein ACOC7U_09295 [Spirochaetota bacterium]
MEFFKTLGSYSLVHINTHGDLINWNNTRYTAIGTNDKRNTDQDLAYEINGDFESIRVVLGRGVYVVGNEDPWVSEDTYYFVTDRFFDTYVSSFPDYSLVYMDACYSAFRPINNPPPELPPLPKVLIENKNVASYLGWTLRVANEAAIRASNYLYTCMFSDNERFEPKNPPLIPWGLTDSFDGLQTLGYEIDEFKYRSWWQQAELIMIPKNYGSQDQFDLRLLPTITGLNAVVDPVEQTAKLEILGDFGQKSGQAWKCDQPQGSELISCDQLSVESWDEYKIAVDITGCTDCTGYIMVSVDDRDSNLVPLTLWKGELTISGTCSDIGPDVDGTVQFSASGEIVDERSHPETEPQITFAQFAAPFSLNSKFEYQFSGTFEDSSYIYYYPAESNQGTLNVSASNIPAFTGAVMLDPEESIASFQITILAEAFVQKTDKNTLKMTTDTISVPIPLVFDADMTRYGTIQAGSEPLGTLSVEWDQIVPESAPDQDTPR